jgi:HEAT repeat protein
MSVSYRELVPSLASLALNMLDNGSSALTLNQAGMVLFDPALLAVRAARSVRLMTVADGYVKFAHSLLRDYYASLHLTPLDVTMRLQSPQFAQDGERLQGRWDSVIEIMSGVQPATDNLVRTVAEIDPFLAAQCLGAGARVTPGVRSMVLDGLLNEVDEPAKHPAIRRALTALSVDQTLPTAIERLRFGSDGLKSAAVWAVKEFHVPLPLALLKALKDWDWTPNEHAAAVLQKAPQWDETIAAFINILDDSNPDRRRGAAWALGVLADRAAAPALREALKDNQQSVRDMAAKALRQIEQRYPESAAPVPAPAVRSAATPAVRTKAPLVGPPSAPLPKPVQTAASARERLTRQTGETRRAIQNSDQTGPNLQDLLRKLTFPDWGDRREAVRQLGELGTQDVVMPLLESLHDSDDQVRFAAVQALSQFSDDNVRQALLEVLADESDVVACAAADVLTRFTPAPVHELLAIVMKLDHPPEMRGIAIEALGTIGDPLAEPVLIESLNDETPLRMEGQRICDLAADALEKLGTETALAAAAEWRHEQQPTQPLRPVEEPSDLLSFVAADEELDTTRQADEPIVALMQAFRTASLHDQHDASLALRDHARSLRGLDTQRALVALANGLRDGDPIIRWASVQGLAWLQDENAIPYLHESLHDRHFTVRLAAIRALQEINDRNAVWALLERLRDDNALIREKAAEALGRLGDESVAVRLTDALYDDEPFVRHAAAVSLGVIGSAYAVDALIDAVQNDELMVCLAAVESLGKIGDAKAVPVIEPLLDDTNKPLWDERRVCDIAADALRLIARQVPEAGAALARWQERQGASHA